MAIVAVCGLGSRALPSGPLKQLETLALLCAGPNPHPSPRLTSSTYASAGQYVTPQLRSVEDLQDRFNPLIQTMFDYVFRD